MDNIVINTSSLRNCWGKLNDAKRHYSNQKSSFSQNYFGNVQKLNLFLENIQKTYTAIESNIGTVSQLLKEYYEDIEGLECRFSGMAGAVKAQDVSNIVLKYKDIIKRYTMDDADLFKVSNTNGGRNDFNDPFLEEKVKWSQRGTCVLAYGEGVVNVIEGIVDGGGMLLATRATFGRNICNFIGFEAGAEYYDNQANACGDFVKRDLSKELYYWATDATGLSSYADPNSTAAQMSSIAGNIVGEVALVVATAGIGASVAGSATAATTITANITAVENALSMAGNGGENALKRGATIEQAEIVSASEAGVGYVTGKVTGKLNAAARALGTSKGVEAAGKILSYNIASAGVNASEPLANLMISTAVYRNNGDYLNSLYENAQEDNLVFNMVLAGGTDFVGTTINGLIGIKKHNLDITQELNPTLDITQELKEVNYSLGANPTGRSVKLSDAEIQVKMDEYNRLLEKNEGLKGILVAERQGKTVDYGSLYEPYQELKRLEVEITTGQGTVSKYEGKLAERIVSSQEKLRAIPNLSSSDDYLKHMGVIKDQPVDFYLKNIDYFNQNQISFETYLKKTGIDVGRYSFSFEGIRKAAVDFKDKSMLLYFKGSQALSDPNIDPELASKIKEALGKTSYDIAEGELEFLLKDYFTPEEVQALNDIGTSYLKSLPAQQQKSIYQFTSCGGCEVDKVLRGERGEHLTSLFDLEKVMDKENVSRFGGEAIRREVSKEVSIVDELVDVIDQHPNDKIVRATRYVNDLGASGIITAENLDTFIGQTITDDAFGSFTLLDGAKTSYSKSKGIKIDAYIAPNSGTLIQGSSRLSMPLSEFLVKPGFSYTILDAYQDAETQQIVLKALVKAN